MHTQKPLSNSPAGLGLTKRGTRKPLRVWSLLHERDKSRNSKLAAVRMAGAFVHWRQVGNLVFNDQLVSVRFTFQSSPFCPQCTSPKLCLILNSSVPDNSNSLPGFFLGVGVGRMSWSPSLLSGSGIKKEAMENAEAHTENTMPEEKANVCRVRMVLSYLWKPKLRGGDLWQSTVILTSL